MERVTGKDRQTDRRQTTCGAAAFNFRGSGGRCSGGDRPPQTSHRPPDYSSQRGRGLPCPRVPAVANLIGPSRPGPAAPRMGSPPGLLHVQGLSLVIPLCLLPTLARARTSDIYLSLLFCLLSPAWLQTGPSPAPGLRLLLGPWCRCRVGAGWAGCPLVPGSSPWGREGSAPLGTVQGRRRASRGPHLKCQARRRCSDLRSRQSHGPPRSGEPTPTTKGAVGPKSPPRPPPSAPRASREPRPRAPCPSAAPRRPGPASPWETEGTEGRAAPWTPHISTLSLIPRIGSVSSTASGGPTPPPHQTPAGIGLEGGREAEKAAQTPKHILVCAHFSQVMCCRVDQVTIDNL